MGWTPERLLEKVEFDTNGGCWLWTGWLHDDGYGRIQIPGQKKKTGAHRIAHEVFIGPILPGQVVMHTCDVRPCINPAHLRAGTQLENIADRHVKGRSSRSMGRKGEKNSHAILSEDKVLEIKTLISNGVSQSKIASSYGVSKTAISLIKSGKNWSHLNVV